MKGCLNCLDNLSCLECGNVRTGLAAADELVCLNIVKDSCPLGTGYELRMRRCVDCSYFSQKFYNPSIAKQFDPLVCNPKNVYEAIQCNSYQLLVHGMCLNGLSNAGYYNYDNYIQSYMMGCMVSQGVVPATICIKCSPFYKQISGTQICLSKTNGGLGNCEWDINNQKCSSCSDNDVLVQSETVYDPTSVERNDISYYNNPADVCPVKNIVRLRYSYNIDQSYCTKFYSVFFSYQGKTLCVTSCPSKKDNSGQFEIDYYTQWKQHIIVDNNDKNLMNMQGECVEQCDSGYALDEESRTCYECNPIQNCHRCSTTNFSQCIECIPGYFLNDLAQCQPTCSNYQLISNNIQLCVTCQIPNCTGCSLPTQCAYCSNNATPQSNCTVCQLGYAKHWKDPTQCVKCNTQYNDFYIDQLTNTCHERCGKGAHFTEELECDDANLLNGDGCNSLCQIEKQWKCQGGSKSSPENCIKVVTDEIISDSIDQNFTFSISFQSPTQQKGNALPYILIIFSKKFILKQGVSLKDVFEISISSLSSDQYSYDIVSLQDDTTTTPPNRQLQQQNTQEGFKVYMKFQSTIMNQQVVVFVDQKQITNVNGQILYKNSDIVQIKKYTITTEEDKKQIDNTNAIAQSAQGAALISGVSLAFLTNINSLMSIVDITEIIYYFLFLDIQYPDNVSSFFKQFDNFQLPFLPNPFDHIINDVNQHCHPHVYELDTDSLFIRNSGTNIFAVSLYVGLFIFVKLISVIINRFCKFEKVKKFFEVIVFKLQYNYSIELFYIVFLNFAASAFLQFQDTSIQPKSSKEHTAELINMITFAVCFAICLILPTLFFIKIWKNRSIIESEGSHSKKEQSPSYQTPLPSSSSSCYQTPCCSSDQQCGGFCQEVNIEEEKMNRIQKDEHHKEFMEKWEGLIVGCKTTDFKLYIYNVITYYRKLMLVAIIMLMMDYAELQLILLVVHHIAVAIYITKYMPFETIPQNIINVASEVLFILLEVFIMRLTSSSVDSADEDERKHIGNWIIGFFLSIIGIHLLLMIFEILSDGYSYIKKKFKKRSSKVVSTIHILSKEKAKNAKSNPKNDCAESTPPSVNNSIAIAKGKDAQINKNQKIQNLNQNNAKESNLHQKYLKESAINKNTIKLNQPIFESKSIMSIDSCTLATTPLQENNLKTFNKSKLKVSKDTSPFSDEGNIIAKKSSSDEEMDDDYNKISMNIINSNFTPTGRTPMSMSNHRRRSTRTSDQTPFNLKSNRLSMVFNKEQQNAGQAANFGQTYSNLKIPTLMEVHETSNSPQNSGSNHITCRNEFTQSQNNLQTSAKNTPERDVTDKLKQDDAVPIADSPIQFKKFSHAKSRNASRFSLLNIKSDNNLIQNEDNQNANN